MAAVVTDLSTTGARLTTEKRFDIPGGRIILEAEGSGGRRFSLTARVIRRAGGPAGMSLGCEFDQPDEISPAAQCGDVVRHVGGAADAVVDVILQGLENRPSGS